MKVLLSVLLLAPAVAFGQVVNPPGGGGPPTGSAGGDLSGTYPNPSVAASHITSGGAAFTDKVSAASTSSTATTPTLAVTDNETGASIMYAAKILSPNMANNNTSYIEFGNAETTNNSFLLLFGKVGSGNALNRLSIQPLAVPIALSIFAGTQDVNIGSSVSDSGFKLDVQGTSRSTTHTLTTAASAAGQIGYDSTGSRFSAYTGGLVGTPTRTIFTLLSNTPTITATVTPSSILNGAATVQGTTTLPSGYITVARKFRIGISGVFSLVSTDTMTVSFSIGGTTITSTPAMNLGATVTNGEYNVDLQVTCRSVAANVATCVVRGWAQADTATGGQREVYSMFNGGNTFTIPTNVANLLDVTLAFSSTSASDSATSFSAGVYEIN